MLTNGHHGQLQTTGQHQLVNSLITYCEALNWPSKQTSANHCNKPSPTQSPPYLHTTPPPPAGVKVSVVGVMEAEPGAQG